LVHQIRVPIRHCSQLASKTEFEQMQVQCLDKRQCKTHCVVDTSLHSNSRRVATGTAVDVAAWLAIVARR
jgi:hypothetical protein